MTNPMLQEDFVFSSMRCKPLIEAVAEAAGMPDVYRAGSLYGEGGPAAYTMGFDTLRGEEVFIFSVTTMTEQPTADRMLAWAAASEAASLCVVAPRFSAEFMADLASRWDQPVYFVRALPEEPHFVRMTDADTVPTADDTCQECLQALDVHPGGQPCGPKDVEYHKALRKRLGEVHANLDLPWDKRES